MTNLSLEDYTFDGHPVRVLTCQVHFEDGSMRQFSIVRQWRNVYSVGFKSAACLPALDLRQWDGQPIYANKLLAESLVAA